MPCSMPSRQTKCTHLALNAAICELKTTVCPVGHCGDGSVGPGVARTAGGFDAGADTTGGGSVAAGGTTGLAAAGVSSLSDSIARSDSSSVASDFTPDPHLYLKQLVQSSAETAQIKKSSPLDHPASIAGKGPVRLSQAGPTPSIPPRSCWGARLSDSCPVPTHRMPAECVAADAFRVVHMLYTQAAGTGASLLRRYRAAGRIRSGSVFVLIFECCLEVASVRSGLGV